MMDLYSFNFDEESLEESYQTATKAYKNIYSRCGLATVMVEADSGAIGGKDSHEFMVLTETGEDEIIYCPKCGYAANVEKAQTVKDIWTIRESPLPLEEVATPGAKTIEEVANFLKISPSRTLKAVFYSADGEIVFVVIRGDLEVNEVKLKNALKCNELRLASDSEVEETKLVAGSASPVGLSEIKVIADDSVTMGSNFVAGANKSGYHLKNVNYPRDFQVSGILDIATAQVGQGCPVCGEKLLSERGIEVGHIFKLGTLFSEKLGAFYLNSDGIQKPIVMGCYGIGVGRLLAAAIEQNHDEKGIIWTPTIAPYQVYLCALNVDRSENVVSTAQRLYTELEKEGIEVLFDDRVESPGVKFNDADLLGIPIRIVVSPRTLKSSSVEIKQRSKDKSRLVSLEEAVERIKTWEEYEK
jgi:prolyl-tRNA synthetase